MTAGELLRRDYSLIADRIPHGARVLDLGCGDGTLLELVRTTRDATVTGVDLDLANVAACVARDIPVIQANLDDGLAGFPDDGFDCVILSQTLQVVRKPALVVREMLRVGRRGIVSFPNFGHWRVRSYLAIRGRMPVSRSIPYSWYETPNIHHTTLKDFREFVSENGGMLAEEIPLRDTTGSASVVHVLPNLFADTAVAVIERMPCRPRGTGGESSDQM
jgi:methionine biosynthesis protein MetW